MNITISENLKKYRQQKQNTQEDLANHLGISYQAVSKWERDEGYPDIVLLPAIAAYYKISVDDLLGVGTSERRKRIDEYHVKSREYQARGEEDKDAELWKDAFRAFPDVLEVIFNYARTLPAGEERIHLNERLIRESTEEDNYYYVAMQDLCYTNKDLGDIEKAKEYAKKLPIYYVTENQIMMSLLKGEEAVAYMQYNIMMLTDLIWLNTINLAREGDYSPDEKICMYEYAISMFKLMLDSEDLGSYFDRTNELYLRVSQNYAQLKDLENTLENLETSAEHLMKNHTKSAGKYTSPLTNRKSYEAGNPSHTQGAISWFLGETADPCFDFCRNNVRFIAVIESAKLYQF